MNDHPDEGPAMDDQPHGDELHQRLARAFPRTVDPARRGRDLAVVDAALLAAGPDGRWQRIRRRGAAAILVGALVGAPAAAVASESALPGEVLYPVKRATEAVSSIFLPDVVAQHRVEEVEVLARRDEVAVEQVVGAAVAAVEATDRRGDEDQLRERALAAAEAVRLALLEREAGTDRLTERERRRLVRLEAELRLRHEARAERGPGGGRRGDRPGGVAGPGPSASDRPGPEPRPTAPEPSASSDAPGGADASPRPSRSPAPTRSPAPSRSPQASPSAGDQEVRRERHAVGRAGVVHLEVRRDGVRLLEVVTADGWVARDDRSREPAGVAVEFRHRRDDRGLLFTARYRDDGTVVTAVRELPPRDDRPGDESTEQRRQEPSPSQEPTRSSGAERG